MLPHLIVRTARTVVKVTVLASLLGFAAATVRVLPWLVAPDVPASASLVFLGALAIASLEVVLLVALPLGVVLAVTGWVQDGTSGTLATLGMSPAGQCANVAWVAIAAAALGFATSTRAAEGAFAPGRLSNAMVSAARSSGCATEAPARIPLLEVAWLCDRDSRRLAGAFPSDGPAAFAWTASTLTFSDDLDRFSLSDAHWALRKPRVNVRADTIVITGFAPWVTPSSAHPLLRAGATSTTSLLAALASAWSAIRWPSVSRARAVVMAATPLVAFLTVGVAGIQALGWAMLPVLACTAILLPMVIAWATRPRLLTGGVNGTKRVTAQRGSPS